MKLTRRCQKSPGLSRWGSLLAVIVINTCLNNCHIASASKEEVDEQSLSAMKSDRDMNSIPNAADGIGSWKPPPCFYPCFHNYYNNDGDDSNPDLAKRNFNAWGGKRNFNPWGGKRSPLSEYFRQMSELVKKGGFNPWGGKRNPDPNSRSSKDEYPSARRLPFNPWGGR